MTTVIIVCIIISIICFFILKSANSAAENGSLSSTQVIYLNGFPDYQSGVEVKIQANTNTFTIDNKYHIPIQKITDIKIAKTKQLTDKQKNIIGRAIIGTLIGGEIGGIIGGMSGIGTAKKTEDVEILYITYKDQNENEKNISFAITNLAEKSLFLNSWVLGMNQRINTRKILVTN